MFWCIEIGDSYDRIVVKWIWYVECIFMMESNVYFGFVSLCLEKFFMMCEFVESDVEGFG